MLRASEMRPMIAGKNAPPTIAITISDEPRFVSAPRFLMPSAKMVGNIMEWKKPMNTTAHTGITPVASKATVAQTRDAPAKRDSKPGAATFFISGADETPGHKAHLVQQQIQRCHLRRCSWNRELRVANHEACYSNLSTDIEKLRDDAFDQMRMRQHALHALFHTRRSSSHGRFHYVRQVRWLDQYRDNNEN